MEQLNQALPQTLEGNQLLRSTVAIHEHRAIAASSRSGEVRFYARGSASGTWVLETSIPIASEIRNVALLDDVAVIGLLDLDNPSLPGAVQTFRRSGGVWQPDVSLTSIGSGPDVFGDSVALSQTSDGSTWLMVGAPRQEFGSVVEQGFVFAYREIGGTWALQELIEAPTPGDFDQFGRSLSLDGDRLAVSAPVEDPRVVMFEFTGTEWVSEAVLRSENEGGAPFGESLDLEGDRLVVSEPYVPEGQGRALLFEAPFTDASIGLPLIPNGPRAFYALEVAVSKEVILVANFSQPGVAAESSRVDVYRPVGGTWAQTSSIEPSDNLPFQYGFGVSMDLVGTELIVGNVRRPNPGTGWGAVYLFDLFPAETTTYCTSFPGSSEHPANLWTEGSKSVSANELKLRAGPVPDQPGLFFYGLDPAAQPFGGGVLCIAGPPIFRLPIEQADGGILHHRLDLNSPPSAAGQILAGSQWRFQAWFRDPQGGPGATFRTSSAAQLSFVP